MNTDYDIAVLGGGLAGLSVLYHLQKAGKLTDRKVLLIDPEGRKSSHDRSWSFWEKGEGAFEDLVYHRWETVTLHDQRRNVKAKLAPYTYKLIRSTEFYAYVNEVLDAQPNIHRIQASAEAIQSIDNHVEFTVAGEAYRVDTAFSSLPLHLRPRQIKQPYLDQHFRGWFINTERDVFDPTVAALMDFRTPQHNETRFFYVMPFSPTRAMVEIAIFSNNHLRTEEYDELIAAYLEANWTPGPYEVEHTEDGNIPMTTYPFPRRDGNLIYIGLRGGAARPSTGYTFYGLQRQLRELAEQFPGAVPAPWSRKDLLYDATILDILQNNHLPGDQVFVDLFEKNQANRLMAFLNGESTLVQDLGVMATTKVAKFGAAFVRQAIQ